MPAKIVVVSPQPISASEFGPEIEIESGSIAYIGSDESRLPEHATGLLIYSPVNEPIPLDLEALVAEAISMNIPILGSGSGMHILNVALGGDVPRPTPQHDGGADGKPVPKSMFLAPGAKVSSTIGGSGWLTIPRRQKKGIFQSGLAPGLMVSAISDDRVVEAFEMPGRRWCIGVQWDVLADLSGAIKMPRGFDGILMSFVERATGK